MYGSIESELLFARGVLATFSKCCRIYTGTSFAIDFNGRSVWL